MTELLPTDLVSRIADQQLCTHEWVRAGERESSLWLCLQCGATTDKHPLPALDVSTWPRDPANGRLLCSPEKPMPKGAAGRWAHTNVETVGSDSDFQYGTEWDRKRCKDCGLEWEQEVPQ